MKRYITGFIILSFILASSCGKDYLDLSPNNILTIDNYYKTQDDAIAATNAVYTPLQGLYNGAMWHIGDIMSDDCDLGGGGGGDGLETAELDNFTLTSFNPIIKIYWTQCYQGIERANIVLDKVPGITDMSSAIKTRCLGEARFLRGFYYFQLVRLFGDVPLYTKPITVDESKTLSRSSSVDVYNQVIADLKLAADSLPQKYTGEDIGRATSGAAKGMLADVYLTIGDKTNAAGYAMQVIQSGTYQLNADYADNYNLNLENGKESLFEVQYRNSGGCFCDYGQGQKLNCFFAPRDQNLVYNQGYGWNVPTLDFANQYERTNPLDPSTIIDKRRQRSMWMPGDKDGSYTQPDQLVGSPNGFDVKKYYVPTSIGGGDGDGWTCALNVPVMRYSEVLLIYAEAAGAVSGKAYIDQVRARAGLSPLPILSDAAYLDAIYKERRIEFAFEMHRWFDLLRNPDSNYFLNVMKAAGKTNIQAFHRYMPIPQSERDINPNLTQNPGY